MKPRNIIVGIFKLSIAERMGTGGRYLHLRLICLTDGSSILCRRFGWKNVFIVLTIIAYYQISVVADVGT